jgi:hypothetical protein
VETQVRTPQMVFMQPQRLVVPLFQRPYVWNEENQWEPLWNDLVRVADRLLREPNVKYSAAPLAGAVVSSNRDPQLQAARDLLDPVDPDRGEMRKQDVKEISVT